MDNNREIINKNIISYKRWLFYEFKERIFQKKNPMYDFMKNNIDQTYNQVYREIAIKFLKNHMHIDTNTIVTIFKLRNVSILDSEVFDYSNEVNYAFLYSTIKINKKTSNVKHVYFCYGPNLTSKDGEYRQNILRFNTLQLVINKYVQLWNKIEEYVLRRIEKLTWNYYVEYFFPLNKRKTDSIMIANVNNGRLPIKFLIISWFVELAKIVMNIPVNHVNKLYMNIMKFTDKKILAEDEKFYRDMENEFGKHTTQKLLYDLSIFSLMPKSDSLRVGQKLIPLNITEIQNPFNINYKPWKEFLILEKIQNLIINGICKGFSFVGDYFYIKDVRKTIFDSYVQYMKMEHSEQAKYIIKKLVEAQMATFYITEITPKKEIITDDSLEEISSWLSEKFKRLCKKINDPIEYSKRNLIMSKVALGITSEYVGRSFYDFLLFSGGKDEKYIDDAGNILKNFDLWSKYIFECIYNLLCLNIHLGIMHGDLHLNNVTVNPMFYGMDVIQEKQDKTSYMLYIISDHKANRTVFGFPSRQYHTCIIDFSRSIIKLDKYEKYATNDEIKTNLSKKFTIKPENKVKFNKEQIDRILLLYEQLFPDMYEQHVEGLTNMISVYFDQLFPTLTAFDIYRFSLEIIRFFEKYKKIKNTRQFELVKDINKKAENYLTYRLIDLIKNPDLITNKKFQTYFNLDIINEYFCDYIVMEKDNWKQSAFHKLVSDKNATIISVDFLDNEINYSMNDLKKIPAFLKYTKLMYEDGKIKKWKSDQINVSDQKWKDDEEKKKFDEINTIAIKYRKGKI